METQQNQVACPAQAAGEVLAEIGIGLAEFAALRRQGFVSAERRGPRLVIYKLRYRVKGRQRVRYIGSDAIWARQVQEALSRWQEERRLTLDVARLCKDAARQLAKSKRRLEPLLTGRGFHFHGRAIRSFAAAQDADNKQ